MSNVPAAGDYSYCTVRYTRLTATRVGSEAITAAAVDVKSMGVSTASSKPINQLINTIALVVIGAAEVKLRTPTKCQNVC